MWIRSLSLLEAWTRRQGQVPRPPDPKTSYDHRRWCPSPRVTIDSRIIVPRGPSPSAAAQPQLPRSCLQGLGLCGLEAVAHLPLDPLLPGLEDTIAGGSLLSVLFNREFPLLRSGVPTTRAPAGDHCEEDVSPVTAWTLASPQRTQETKWEPGGWANGKPRGGPRWGSQAPGALWWWPRLGEERSG